MTTVRELSERLGVSKTTILKFCKEELKLKTSARRTLQLSANQCSIIASHFSTSGQAKLHSTENQTESSLQTSLQMCADGFSAEFSDLKAENSALKAENDGLKEQIALLKERLEVADAALEREQMQARGFWSRLGQKLLGDGGN